MGVITCDKKILVADSQACRGDLISSFTKLHALKIDGRRLIIGVVGECQDGLLFINWVLELCTIRPVLDKSFSALVLSDSGVLNEYNYKLIPIEIKEPFYSIGNGREFATGAMAAGADPLRAVELTCANILGCGLPISMKNFDNE